MQLFVKISHSFCVFYPQLDQVNTADKIQTASLQAVHTSGIIWREVTLVEGSPSQVNKAQAATTVRKPEKLVLEEPEQVSTMRKVFTEVQLLSGTGPTSPLSEVSVLL